MDRKKSLQILSIPMVLALLTNAAGAENIDPDEDDSQYSYGENIGWISFSCENKASCATVQYGVTIISSPGAGFTNSNPWVNFEY